MYKNKITMLYTRKLTLGWPNTLSIFFSEVALCLCLVTQLCPTLWDPMEWSPPSSSVHGDSPGKNIGVGSSSPQLSLTSLETIFFKLYFDSCQNASVKNSPSDQHDGGGVCGLGIHLSPQIHQEHTFRHRSACRTPAESWQEYLTRGKEYIEPHKTW